MRTNGTCNFRAFNFRRFGRWRKLSTRKFITRKKKNAKIFRSTVYKKVVNGREDLWGEYCRLRKEVKQLVIEKKLNIWNELVEKVNRDFDENRKEFWGHLLVENQKVKRKI